MSAEFFERQRKRHSVTEPPVTDHEQAERIAAEAMRLYESTGGGFKPALYPEDQVLLARAYIALAAQLAEAQDSLSALRGLIDTLHAEKRETQAQLAERERALREIADPSYVGNYSPEEVVSIYRKWAAAATHSDSEKT